MRRTPLPASVALSVTVTADLFHPKAVGSGASAAAVVGGVASGASYVSPTIVPHTSWAATYSPKTHTPTPSGSADDPMKSPQRLCPRLSSWTNVLWPCAMIVSGPSRQFTHWLLSKI